MLITDRILKVSRNDDVIFVGPNGSGKSRTLRELCIKRVRDGHHVIAISNTQYSRLPEFSRDNYSHIRVNPDTTNGILKSLVVSALDSKSRSYSSMREILSHTGYLPILDVNISIGSIPLISDGMLSDLISETVVDEKVRDEVRFLVQNLERIRGHHQINLDDIYAFFSEKEIIALAIKNQGAINRVVKTLKGRVTVTFGLRRDDGHQVPVHKASSGELTLITLAMFILTNSDNLEYIFIDEPENSLHPQWQSNFLNFMRAVSRRENISYQLASHSPILLAGALTAEHKVRVVRCRLDGFDELISFDKESDESVEELLWEAFDVITPASRFVAKRVSDLLWSLESQEISRDTAILEIERYKSKSISDDQVDFLNASIDLIKSIAKEQSDLHA